MKNCIKNCMETIIQKYPVKNTETYSQSSYFPYPDFSIDLHGHTKDEATKKLEWVLPHAQYNQYRCIKIITGIGKKILKNLIRQHLKKWKQQEKIKDFKEIIDNNQNKTGVFLYLV